MNDALNLEECRARWREDARARATEEANEAKLQGMEREAFISKRAAEIYAELERIGKENT
jgi:hypothetical protein